MPEALASPDMRSVSWLPGWVDAGDVEQFVTSPESGGHLVARPRSDSWPAIGARLRDARSVLQAMPIASIVDAIGRTAERWCDRDDPVRIAARDRAASASGASKEAVDRSFDVELRNYRASELWSALHRELRDPRALDGPIADPVLGGATMAVGPGIALQIFTGNVPGLPALAIVRALLAKSAVIAKVASGEPTFAASFVASLAATDARLGDAVVVTYWQRDDHATRDAVLAQADVVIAFGGDDACSAIAHATRADQRFVEHANKWSAGILSRGYLAAEATADVARRLARDASMFNQQACIAAQAYLVEGETDEVLALAPQIADAMREYAAACPRGALRSDDAAAEQLRRAAATYRAAQSPRRGMWQGADWAVTVDDDLTGDCPQRTLRLVPVKSLDAALEILRPIGRRLQNVAAGVEGHQMPWLARELALIGASRICAPGRMPDPSLRWRHDGRMCIAELVRWCDVEMHPWCEIASLNAQKGGEGDGTPSGDARRDDRLHVA